MFVWRQDRLFPLPPPASNPGHPRALWRAWDVSPLVFSSPDETREIRGSQAPSGAMLSALREHADFFDNSAWPPKAEAMPPPPSLFFTARRMTCSMARRVRADRLVAILGGCAIFLFTVRRAAFGTDFFNYPAV